MIIEHRAQECPPNYNPVNGKTSGLELGLWFQVCKELERYVTNPINS